MPCVKGSHSELKLAKHLHTLFVLTLRNPVLGSTWLRSSSQSKAILNLCLNCLKRSIMSTLNIIATFLQSSLILLQKNQNK